MPLEKNFRITLLVDEVSTLLHEDKYLEAGQRVARWLGESSNVVVHVEDRARATEVLTLLLHWLLDNEGYEEAAQLLWGPQLFSPKPESAQRVWRAFEESNWILLMGAASMSKSYSMGVRLMLEWIRDPEYTNIKVLGPSENHLEDNLFTHLVTLHRQSTIPLPGHVGKLYIGIDARARKGAITGVVIPLGKKAAGRIQGAKRTNRRTPHPKFGTLSRMFIFLDEIANIPVGVWKDIDNVVASSQGDSGLKIIGAFNPTNIHDEVGIRVEPPKGWSEMDPDTDVDWVSTRGWRVVRLDAARCENVVSGKIIYPGLQTKEGFQLLITNSGGTDSPGYWAMGRGMFPPTGVPMSIIPAGLLTNIKAEPIWYDRPTPCASVDLAFLGGDTAVYTKGSFGPATGIKFPPSLDHPNGRTIMFKSPKGATQVRNVVWAELQLKLPKAETRAMTDEIKRVSRSFGVRPDWLCVDKTGSGTGVFDLLRFEYGEVLGVNYSESCSIGRRIMVEDHDVCENLYDRIHTEVWFASRKFIEFGYCYIAPGFDTELLFPQLTNRRYKMTGKRARVEKKEDYQSRCSGKSPDEADSFNLLIQCVRRASGFVPGITPENSSDVDLGNDEDDGDEVRIDATNRVDSLD